MERKTSTNSFVIKASNSSNLTKTNELQKSLIHDLSLRELASLVGGVAPPSPTRPLPGANVPPMPWDALLTIGQNPLGAALTITTSGPNLIQATNNAFQQALRDLERQP